MVKSCDASNETYGAPSSAEPGGIARFDLLVQMSHEMRTPLNAIVGFAQLMESGTPPPTASQQRGIDLILQAGWHMEKLINMVRDLALIESGASSLSLAPVSLAAVMRESQAMIESQAQRRGVRVLFPRLATPCFVSADPIRLQQVLANLASAAIEYSGADGTVIVNCEIHGAESIHIGIEDDGMELAEGPSTRVPRSLEGARPGAAAEGLGIGLLLARRLVVLMGGAIGVDSIVGARRLFSFDLTRLALPVSANWACNSTETSGSDGISGELT